MGVSGKKAIRLTSKTASSFGFEWERFPDIFQEYRGNFLSYIDVPESFFSKKLVLDAGCGAGRHSYFAHMFGAEVVAIDVSNGALASAHKNLDGLPNISILNSNIYDFTYPKQFDYVMCIGVLHHLPEPELGFLKLVSLLKPGGVISIWVYAKRDNKLALCLYEPVRKVTTRIPHRILYWLSLPLALTMEGMNRSGISLFKHYSKFPFRTKWNDVFDVFSAPSARYYSLSDIEGWCQNAGLHDVKVSYRILNGAIKGIKAYGVR